MTRLEKCEILKSKGYTYNPDTGKVFNRFGKELTAKTESGYIIFFNNLKVHHYAYFITYNNVDFEMLDHINRDRSDNRLSNLRVVTPQQNGFNTSSKGYFLQDGKWRSQITINRKKIHLGYFNTEDEARQTYLIAKEKYHII